VSAQENEALVRWFFEEAWGKGNLAAVDEYIAADYVEHTLPLGSQQGRDALKQFVAMYHEAFPDLKVTMHDIFGRGDRVSTVGALVARTWANGRASLPPVPEATPELYGWEVTTYYGPAREVGGDFYDFLEFEDGRLGLVVGDATGKGVPAALMMASARSTLRAVAQASESPGDVLRRANDPLATDIPTNMFVTCFYAILDPEDGHLRYANAGHNLPCRRHDGQAEELRARGMPLGLMPGMDYEEKEISLGKGESVLFYSDGLVEAHDPKHEMFGFPRLQGLVGTHRSGGSSLIGFFLSELTRFTGEEWEQEDDITLVTLQRSEQL
jgi:predicted SnoaL-like aldol condensation-catalyzing enzyme